MEWTPRQLDQHEQAARLLIKIKDEVFAHILENEKNVSEWQTHEFILSRYKKYGLTVAKNQTIVAFGKNTHHIHYYPVKSDPKSDHGASPFRSKTFYLKPNTLIMLDIWARLKEPGAPYADITWMGYYGEISDSQFLISKKFKEVGKVFDVVREARDLALAFVRQHAQWGILPTGREVDAIARNYIKEKGFGDNFRHSTGHGLGLVSPHWRGRNISPRNLHALLPRIGYTIEPGIYLDNKFGVRSEMNFYIDERGKVIVTTPMQKKLLRL